MCGPYALLRTLLLLSTLALLLYLTAESPRPPRAPTLALRGCGVDLSEAAAAAGGEPWRAQQQRRYTCPLQLSRAAHVYTEAAVGQLPTVTPAALEGWWEEDEASSAGARRPVPPALASACAGSQWVVLAASAAPQALALQLGGLEGWCTVVVADSGTPVAPWRALAPRVRLLTPHEQAQLRYRSIPHLASALHPAARKNLGYLYAISSGAQAILDARDGDALLPSAGAPAIPVLASRGPQRNAVRIAQALHCASTPAAAHVPPASSQRRRTWNPHVPLGAPLSWPRGLPLEDVLDSQTPCAPPRSAAGAAGSALPYTYTPLHHPTPGLRFAVQVMHPGGLRDVDAVHRLTRGERAPPTAQPPELPVPHLDFDALYAPDHVYAPYSDHATLLLEPAFWSALLPISAHERVADVHRSYIAQRLMQRYGLRVAFAVPPAGLGRGGVEGGNASRSSEGSSTSTSTSSTSAMQDFVAETPLYLGAGGLVDFLRAWMPSAPDLPLPAEMEELWVALYEFGVVEEGDVALAQAWLGDLLDAGYAFPTLSDCLYHAWQSTGTRADAPAAPLAAAPAAPGGSGEGEEAGALVVSLGHSVGGAAALQLLAASLGAARVPARASRGATVSVLVFHAEPPFPRAPWLDVRALAPALRAAAPLVKWEFHAVGLAARPGAAAGSALSTHWDSRAHTAAFLHAFLLYAVHFHPALARHPRVWYLPPPPRARDDVSVLGQQLQVLGASSLYTAFQVLGVEGREVVVMGEGQRVAVGGGEGKALNALCSALARLASGSSSRGGRGRGRGSGGHAWGAAQGSSGICGSARADLASFPWGVAVLEEEVFRGGGWRLL